MKALYVLAPDIFEKIYGESEKAIISSMVDLIAPPLDCNAAAARPDLLEQVEVIFSGWGSPKLDQAFLDATPNLKLFLYAAGSIKGIVTDEFWKRGIAISSAWAANAVPVSEFTLAEIVLSLKRAWYYMHRIRADKARPERVAVPGCYGSVVGLISLGMIGRLVRERLKPLELQVIGYDPYFSPEEAQILDIEMFPLDEVFKRADVVSLHTPWLKETEHMIRGHHFASMKPGATFINTSRGAIVHEEEMIEVLRSRPDLFAVLDVTYPEPPEPGSPLYTLPNVVLTPHIAGSMDSECRRLARYMIEECRRFLAGEPLRWKITREQAQRMA